MGVVGKWSRHAFEVSPSVLRSFGGLQIKSSIQIEDKSVTSYDYKQNVVRRKTSKATEISITVQLNAHMGCDVRNEAFLFAAEAQACAKDYFYVGDTKLYPCKLALTEATVQNIEIAPNGTWLSAEVLLTLKQYSKLEGEFKTALGLKNTGSSSSTSSSNNSNKQSVNKTNTTTTKKTSSSSTKTSSSEHKSLIHDQYVKKQNDAVKNANKSIADALKSAVKKATDVVSSLVSAAKKATSAKKSTTTSTTKTTTSTAKRGSANRK